MDPLRDEQEVGFLKTLELFAEPALGRYGFYLS